MFVFKEHLYLLKNNNIPIESTLNFYCDESYVLPFDGNAMNINIFQKIVSHVCQIDVRLCNGLHINFIVQNCVFKKRIMVRTWGFVHYYLVFSGDSRETIVVFHCIINCYLSYAPLT